MTSVSIDGRALNPVDVAAPVHTAAESEPRESFRAHLEEPPEEPNAELEDDPPSGTESAEHGADDGTAERRESPSEPKDQPRADAESPPEEDEQRLDEAVTDLVVAIGQLDEVSDEVPAAADFEPDSAVAVSTDEPGTFDVPAEADLVATRVVTEPLPPDEEVVVDRQNVDVDSTAAISHTEAEGDSPEEEHHPRPAAGSLTEGEVAETADKDPVRETVTRPPGDTVSAAPDAHAPVVEQAEDEQERSRSRKVEPQLKLSEAANSKSEPSTTRAEPPAARLAEQLLPKQTQHGERTEQLESAQQARLIERVTRAFQAAEGRGTPLRLRLHPPELGALKLELRMQNQTLTARIEAETPVARQLLLENLPVLRERLSEQGVRIEQFSVDLEEQRSGTGAENGRQDLTQSGDSERRQRGDTATDPEPGEETQRSQLIGGQDQINIVV